MYLFLGGGGGDTIQLTIQSIETVTSTAQSF